MSPTPAVTSIRTGHGIELGMHEVLDSRPAVSTFTKYPDLIYKI